MTHQELDRLLNALPDLRIGVIGDFCLDAYWTVDLSASEASLETGLPTRPIRQQRTSLGGAGNVVANLADLAVGLVHVFGVLGRDPFGSDMQRLLHARKADLTGMLVQDRSWDTPAYVKPIRDNAEEARTDFGNFNRLENDVAARLLTALEQALPRLDAVIVNQQLRHGLHTPFFQDGLNDLIAAHPNALFVVNSRDLADVYTGCVHAVNDVEAARLCGAAVQPGDLITLETARHAAEELLARWHRPVFVTRGARGSLVVDETGIHQVPGLHIIGRTDPVGAGDSMLAGLTAALAAGASPLVAATFGSFVAGVTVQKLFQTGTATPDEIRAIGRDPDYDYQPELAADPRSAVYLSGTEIETVAPLPASSPITHALFDHDGTLSTLRQGWERVMEPMMIAAILGDRYASADETLYARVVARVRDFIDQTTGIQTLRQMQGLTDLVREFAIVPPDRIRDAAGYKHLYNRELMAVVRRRAEKLRRGELDVSDVTIKGAIPFLAALHGAGVKLYLASGTDQQDVEREAAALGYARLFEGHVYGAVGDVTAEAKQVVMRRILSEIGAGNMANLAAFGDGPVEVREARKRGAAAIGVASDEVRRFGLNREKRARLIRAGAHVVVPDWSQREALLALLRVGPAAPPP